MTTIAAILALTVAVPITLLILGAVVVALRSQRMTKADQAHARQLIDAMTRLARVVVRRPDEDRPRGRKTEQARADPAADAGSNSGAEH